MRAINHALSGAVIGMTVTDPLIALPAAVASHFVLDAIPHFGARRVNLGGSHFNLVLLLDTLLCIILVTALALWHPKHWLLACLCAFAAAAPDFMWISKYRLAQAGKKERLSHNPILMFHHRIQWFERPIGIVVEIAWLPAMIVLIIAAGQ
jgi:hypothetical protein